ncbi:MAG: hypothetical protein NAG76_13555 [Candidatus Pristimantibacillus lignocellulolyticus]|uniref:Lipoprotein n=1 Tax=Candidatus Pristimantibacillus lignocellulolyticus TaxID=2994561 RepID=A0A9J6ZA06_9BACL|nr:MAG: hypothetical protein NAG76_13555 [Candidatus Pristimantibacillus lignocellulolyticus]
MKKLLIVALIVCISLLAGCSNSNNNSGSGLKEIKTSDLCVTNINLDAKICYGDEKKKVETIVGEGEGSSTLITYDNGIRVMYRGDKVAGVILTEESDGVFESVIDVSMGDSKKVIKDKLGNDNAIDTIAKNLDYFYDSDVKHFIKETSSNKKSTKEEMEKVYVISFLFDPAGKADTIMWLDWRMAMYLQ